MPPAAIPDEATCVGCNYALRGLGEFRCPECGREFDPDRPLSMNLGRPLDAFARAAIRPTGRLPRYFMWMLAVVGVAGPGWLVPSDEIAITWLLLWLTFFIACWLRSMLRRAIVRRYRQPLVILRVDDVFRRKTRLAFALSTALVVSRIPLLLAILVSRPWLDRFAHHVWAEIPATAPPPSGPVWLGAVVVRNVTAGGDVVQLDFYGSGGVMYERTDDGQHLRLSWWRWNPRWRFMSG